ncbi:hypothetical protein G6F57_006183 [Rhizopus arrhizus]|uniref:ADF-H domain-containing protein n=1 Tax=Rhizopus oryzae TaxID=64495 RepID=A0A9P6X2V4_RHIOR|nr:hypothetical protein G6F23_005424 [Rhizopus arrhizus]KAG0763605.1 hypothetical protein G6F24_005881 [Rhizopus arrhizus]KAG0792777.1 hypothetical protein G6F21_004107 [Rhizopus arrhizus]KAG0819236.1 hypothetical protein G6F20_000918 [Rhizopus arrhizus]KAG0834857.1 hypothetical protein G6F19_004995 [Rhizopus arrhizus]
MCDLSDSRIVEAYNSIVEEESANWLILGYHDTRDVISLYSSGSGGLDEFRNHLSDEVLYGFVSIEDKNILITWVSEHVSGVRRARALVHSRSVASLLKLHHAQITASNLNDLSDANIRTRLKLGEQQVATRKSSSSLTDPKQKRASRQQSGIPLPQSPTTPLQRKPSVEDDFVEANETLPNEDSDDTTKLEIDDDTLIKRQEEEQKRKEQEAKLLEEEAKRKSEEEEQRRALKRKQEEEEEQKRKAAAEAERQRMAAEAERQKIAAQKEAERQRIMAEKEAARKLEEERLKKEAEEKRQVEEKKRLQQKLLEAEKNKDVVLSGFISVQPSGSPFWRRRYFTIKGKAMALYRDELSRSPIQVLDLSSVTRLNSVNVDIETFVPNAFVLETKLNGSYQLFADDKKGMETIITALQTVI